MLGFSITQPPPPPPRHQTVIFFLQMYNKFIRKILFNSLPTTSRSTNPCIFFLLNTTCHSLPVIVEGMVSNLQAYPYVTITNKTPHDTFPTKHNHVPYHPGYDPSLYGAFIGYSYLPCSRGILHPSCCDDDHVHNAIASGGTWTASRRGLCLVIKITAALALPGLPDGLVCAPYTSSGTSSSQFSIRMDGDDACSVVKVVA